MNQQQREAARRLAEAKLAACMASRDALRDWAQECRDQVLYLLAQRDDELGRTADGLGQASVGLLRELAAAPQLEPVLWVHGANVQSDRNLGIEGSHEAHMCRTEYHDTQLYASPPQRQPLTDNANTADMLPKIRNLLARSRNLLSHPASWRVEPRNGDACYTLAVEIDQFLYGIGETP